MSVLAATSDMTPATILGLTTGAYLLYTVILLLYRLFFSPLSKIPGPWLTRISTIPEAKALKEQRRVAWVNEIFQSNPGAVAVRTGPSSVSFNHPDAVKAIYGHGKEPNGFGKSKWYDAFSTTGESLFSTRSKKRHATKRRMVSHGFSAQSLVDFEPFVDKTLDKFIARMDALAASGEPFDIYFWFELFTMDLMGELALGDSFGVLEAGRPARYSTLVEQSQRYANMSGLLPFGKSNVKILSWVPLQSIQKLYQARLEYLDCAKVALERRFRDNRLQRPAQGGKRRQDIMQRFIDGKDPETGAKMDFDELRAETSSLMVAGASTGSVTMCWMTYYLNKYPDLQAKIVRQLEDMFPDNRDGTQALAYTALQHLRLLENTEIEVLRLHPPIGYAMPRDTPPQGSVICGVYVPGNVAVGVPPAIIARNPTVYRDPDVFDPERWSGSERTTDLGQMKTCFLGFGYGSRQCIGRGVANQFVMKMMGRLLLRYQIDLEDPSLELGVKEFTIQKPDKRFNVILTRRDVAKK